ncbi:MAG: LysR substrate-binding domain-containing protein [Solimonas sp.]
MATMQLRYIEMFQAIVQAGTLTGAATLLNISQPAATKLLQQAERRLGFPLFVRARGRLHLTPESVLLKEKIERISDELRDLQRLTANLARPGHHLLRVVSTPTLANAIVPKAITHLRKRFSHAAVELSTQHSREMLRSILLRETDIGLTLQELSHPDIHCRPLCIGSLMLIAPAGTWTPLEKNRPISIECLADRPLVGIATMDTFGRQLQSYLERLSPPPRISIWVQTYQIAKELVSAGEGMALVDPFTAVSGGPGVDIRSVEPLFPLRLYVAHRVDGPLNGVQQTFLKCVESIAAELAGMHHVEEAEEAKAA